MTTTLRLRDSYDGEVTFICSNSANSSNGNDARICQADCGRVISCINSYYKQVMVYGRSLDCILRASSPLSSSSSNSSTPIVCLLPLILTTNLHLLRYDKPEAIKSFDQARQIYLTHEQDWTQRESLYMQGFEKIMQGKLRHAIDIFDKLVTLHPRDLFIVKKIQQLAFVLGDRQQMLNIVQRQDVGNACSALPYYHGLLAFSLEECHQLEAAREAVRKGLKIVSDDVWAIHALGHIEYILGNLDDGISLITGSRQYWSECMSFFYCHMNFHLALFYLDKDEYGKIKELVEKHMWPSAQASSTASAITSSSAPTVATSFGEPLTSLSFLRNNPNYAEDQNALLNLLWRFEIRTQTLAGATHLYELKTDKSWFDAQWKSVSERLKSPPAQLTNLFALLHLHTLYRMNEKEKANEMYASIKKTVEKMSAGESRTKLQQVLLPLADAIHAVHTDSENGVERARLLVRSVMDSTSQSTDPSAASSSPSSSSSSSSTSSSPHHPHLSCLIASGEQLGVLSEWYIQLCVTSIKTKEDLTAFQRYAASQQRSNVLFSDRLETWIRTELKEK